MVGCGFGSFDYVHMFSARKMGTYPQVDVAKKSDLVRKTYQAPLSSGKGRAWFEATDITHTTIIYAAEVERRTSLPLLAKALGNTITTLQLTCVHSRYIAIQLHQWGSAT